MEKTIGLSTIDDDCNNGKDIDIDADVDEEGRRTAIVVVTQQHCGDDHHKEVVPMNNFHKEEGFAVACLSDDHHFLFLFHDQAVAEYGSMNVEEKIDILLVTF